VNADGIVDLAETACGAEVPEDDFIDHFIDCNPCVDQVRRDTYDLLAGERYLP
jgi:hypothetical protein